MINRPMLLNLFKKASTPKLPTDTVISTVGLIPVTSHTLGASIVLSPLIMLRAFECYEKGLVKAVYADFNYSNASNYKRPVLAIMQKQSNGLWLIKMPKENSMANNGFDAYVQKSESSQIFQKA